VKKRNVQRSLKKPILIEGKLAVDDRGEVGFVNDFSMSDVKRFYTVTNHKQEFIRAWHAHKKENKYVTILEGVVLITTVKIDNWDNPSKNLKIYKYVLSSKKPSVLFIPGGFAHGFKTLKRNTKLMFFSTATLKESIRDDYRFDAYYWNPWEIIER